MENIFYFIFATLIMIILFIIDGISHQKFKPKNNKLFHAIMIPILLASMAILAIKEINLSILIYPGVILIFLGLYLSFFGLKEIKGNLVKAKRVYDKGIYSKIRHPIYSGLIVSLFGFSLIINSLLFFIYSFLTILMFIWIAFYEEKHLIRRFKKNYEEYKKKTGMFIPRIR
ncbi:MAG TPA: methyltransferase [Candidatus Paceibacterota bacterium]|nr:methyltransferase [Candidatus Paceibacterota bacterium]